MSLIALHAATLTLAMLLGATLQAPIPSEDRASMNNTTTVVAGASLESSGEINETKFSSCPSYHPGNPAFRNKTGCLTGSTLDPVDHETAFRFQSGTGQDWATCGIPRIPQANQRICYRTTIDQCGISGTEYRIYLNQRNEAALQRQCPSESEYLRSADGSERYFQSPRYGCRKGRGTGSLYNYRPNEFCLYNVSISNCETGFTILESFSGSNHQMEEQMRDENGNLICNDYLQLFYGNSKTERFCDNDLTLNLPLTLPTTQFLALFWTDPSTNDLGFKLRAKCRPL